MLKIQHCISEIKTKTVHLNCNNISRNYSFYYIFDLINAVLVSMITLNKNIYKKSYQPQTFEQLYI